MPRAWPRNRGRARPPQPLEFSTIPLRPQGVQARLRLLGPLLGRVPARVPGFFFRLHALGLLAEVLRLASKSIQLPRRGGTWHRGVAAARKAKGRCNQEKKGDRGANGFASVEEDDQAVQSQGDAPVRRRAVLERLEQESELLLRLLGLHPDRAHDALLDVLSMDPDAPARELVSVRREIVELRP